MKRRLGMMVGAIAMMGLVFSVLMAPNATAFCTGCDVSGNKFEGGPPTGTTFMGPPLVGTIRLYNDEILPYNTSWSFSGSCGNVKNIQTDSYPANEYIDVFLIDQNNQISLVLTEEAYPHILDINSGYPVWQLCWPDIPSAQVIQLSFGNMIKPFPWEVVGNATFMPAIPK